MKLSRDDFSPSLDLGDKRVVVDKDTRRIAFRIANWNDAHSGFNQVVRMPKNVNVEAAHVGHAELEDGSSLPVATLPMHTTHAPQDMSAMHAASWYESTGEGVARVRYSTDEIGLRADGVLFSDLDEAKLERLSAAAPSGDWRSAIAVKRPEDFEHSPADLVGACIVSIPGFSPTYTQSPARKFALAASANSVISFEEDVMDAMTAGATPESCDGACASCTCGAFPEGSAVVAPDLAEGGDVEQVDDQRLADAAALIASAAAEQDVEVAELVSSLTADAGEGIHPMDRRFSILEQRVQELEQLVADSIMSM